MVKKSLDAEQGSPRWFIDLNWYEQNGRSFFTLAQGSLCPKCRQRMKEGEVSTADLLKNIEDCCSKAPDFITPGRPALESIFRIFLANGNRPLGSGELGEQLRRWWGGDTYRTSDEFLSRLLKNDQC